ncbi:MAG: aminoacetone oxidase family FAD-binding enzyme [Oscillospiraceae bacterium]|nr:aminoacetone oxidase family FAD-binding enzyme [Oscillospiraceae bacterium]MBR0452198.1 aminoacetone oxidase family FAD-binding enzyme [Oscillospiraceae bacterium]
MQSTYKKYDVCVIGAGASGLCAAIAAKRSDPDVSVVMLEEKDRVGQKILATGNGRCNLSNSHMDISHYGGEADRYSKIIENASDEEFFRSLSLIVYEDQDGRMYPYSNQAASVLNALLRTADSLGIDTECGFRVDGVKKEKGRIIVSADNGREVFASTVVIAIGTPAGKYKYDMQPLLTTTGDELVAFRPALVPMYVTQDVRQMKGARFKADVCLVKDGMVVAEENGEVQVGDGYLGGICIMNLSRFVKEDSGYELTFDMAPGVTDRELDEYIEKIVKEPVKISDVLSGLLPKRVGEELIRSCCDDPFKRMAESLTHEEKKKISEKLRGWTFSVRSLGPVNLAQISTGGVCGLDADTLASPSIDGLFYCGEVVNVDGECGGYNLHWAWTSGSTAGRSAVDFLHNKRLEITDEI